MATRARRSCPFPCPCSCPPYPYPYPWTQAQTQACTQTQFHGVFTVKRFASRFHASCSARASCNHCKRCVRHPSLLARARQSSHEGLHACITIPFYISALLFAGCTRAAKSTGEAVKGAPSTTYRSASLRLIIRALRRGRSPRTARILAVCSDKICPSKSQNGTSCICAYIKISHRQLQPRHWIFLSPQAHRRQVSTSVLGRASSSSLAQVAWMK